MLRAAPAKTRHHRRAPVPIALLALLVAAAAAAAASLTARAALPDGNAPLFASFALSNWRDALVLFALPYDNPNEAAPVRALGELGVRAAADWTASALSAASFALCVDGGDVCMTDPTQWLGRTALVPGTSQLVTNITYYQQAPLAAPLSVSRAITLPPGQSFYVVRYDITNNDARAPHGATLLDYATSTAYAQPSACVNAYWNKPLGSVYTLDASACSGASGASFVVSGVPDATAAALDSFAFQVGSAGGADAPLAQFAASRGASLPGQPYAHAAQASIGLALGVAKIAPGATVSLYVYRAFGADYASSLAAAQRALSGTAEWFDVSDSATRAWLAAPSAKRQPRGLGADAAALYANSLVALKHSLNPTLGTLVASFAPHEYAYKVWGRDGVFAALMLIAAGHSAEGEAYLRWLATAQMRDGDQGFHTNYDWFTGAPIGFVEPQYDSAGAYLLALAYAYAGADEPQRNASLLLEPAVQARVRTLEAFFLDNVDARTGLAPPDYSIWEESSDGRTGQPLPTSFFAFTQAMAYAGVYAAARIEALVYGDAQRAAALAARATALCDAINAHLWMPAVGAYARGIWSDTYELDARLDASSAAVVFAGCAGAARGAQHLAALRANLTRLGAGMARYPDDPFFYDSKYNPGGREVGAPSPPWGVCTMFTAWAELAAGAAGAAASVDARLAWMVAHAAPGAMPVGEAIDGVSGRFVMSSCPDIYEYAGVYAYTVLLSQSLVPSLDPRALLG